MDFAFTILKFVCTFVSGFGAVIAAIPEHRRGKAPSHSRFRRFWRKLNTKESGLYIAIVGLFLALLSQFMETKLNNDKDIENKQRTARLLRNILRLETRFDHVEVDLDCTLNPVDRSFTNYLKGFAFPGIITNMPPQRDIGIYSANWIGYINDTNDIRTSVYFTVDGNATNRDIRTGPLAISTADLETTWIRRGVSQDLVSEMTSLFNQSLLLVSFQGDTNNPFGGNLSVIAYPQAINSINYYPSNNTFRVTLRCEATKIESINKNYTSITDLPHETLRLELYDELYKQRVGTTNKAPGWESRIHPESGDIQLGDFSLPLHDMRPYVDHNDGQPVVTIKLKSPIRDLEGYGY